MEFISTTWNVLLVLLGFGLLILVHEAGHFFAAKWANIRTDAFAIGFGPVLCSFRKGVGFRMRSCDPDVMKIAGAPPRALTDEQLAHYGIGETEYSFRVFPLGGFVRMLGQDDIDPGAVSADPRAFNRASIPRRMVVISAGVFMNLVLAATLFVIAFTMGVQFEAPVVGSVRPGSPAASAVSPDGASMPLEVGDRIVAIDGRPSPTFADVQVAAAMSVPGEVIHMQVRRGDVELQIDATIQVDEIVGLPSLGVGPAASVTLIDSPQLNMQLERLLERLVGSDAPKPGWTLTGLGPRVDDLRDVSSWNALDETARRTAGQPFAWRWSGPDGQSMSGMVEAQPQWQNLRYPDATSRTVVGWEEGIAGLSPMVEITKVVDGSPNAGILEAGDLVLQFNGIAAPTMRRFREAVTDHGIGTVSIVVERSGKRLELTAQIAAESTFSPVPKMQILPGYAWSVSRVAQPMLSVAMPGAAGTPSVIDTPSAGAGIAAGAIFTVPGDHGMEPWRALWEHVHRAAVNGAEEVLLHVQDSEGAREVRLGLTNLWRTKLADLGWEPPLPVFLFTPLEVTRSSNGNPIEAVKMGLHETWNFVVLTYVTIDRLFRGTVGVEQLHGPVGIVHLGTRIADRGLAYMLFFLALISVNLAVLNFLPLPIVDGGLMLYLIYEKFKGRPPSVAFQNGAALVGLLLIGTLFAVTFYNDMLRLIS